MRTVTALALGIALGTNGLWMLVAPASWYQAVPGVADSGPLNAHVVRDVGAAYLITGVGLLWMIADRRAWAAAVAGSAFLAVHAVVHAMEYAQDHAHAANLPMEALLIFVPAPGACESTSATKA